MSEKSQIHGIAFAVFKLAKLDTGRANINRQNSFVTCHMLLSRCVSEIWDSVRSSGARLKRRVQSVDLLVFKEIIIHWSKRCFALREQLPFQSRAVLDFFIPFIRQVADLAVFIGSDPLASID